MTTIPFLAELWAALGGVPEALRSVRETGSGALPSVFAVSDLASASMAAAGLAAADLLASRHGAHPVVTVDRRAASQWFGWSIRPEGWSLPPVWDPIAGDYQTADGWIRLHTNAPHHRAAALEVLGCEADKAAVTRAVARWAKDDLEIAVVRAGGCAAAMRSADEWAAHPQGRAVAAEPLVAWQTAAEQAPAAWALPPDRPLHGLRVLDLTRILAGPVATRFLAGLGADVLRIDPLDWDEPSLIPDVTLGKRCARLDLRSAEGRAALERLLAGADVVVHGYRPGALDGLRLGADRRREIAPGIVDVSLDAYGWSGPWRERRGFDSLVQMSSGIADAGMRRLGKDRPFPLPVQALDHACGYVIAAAVLCGLRQRVLTGRGTTARLSLARIAALLTSGPAGDPAASLGPDQPADFAPEIESTVWGPARRIKAPVTLGGAPMRWDYPAGLLGSSPAAWR